MRKNKLLLAIVGLLLGLATPGWAQSTVGAGTFFIKNVSEGTFLTGANTWGTQASLDEHGLDCKLTLNNGAYTIMTGNSNYLGSNGYVDSSTADWTIEAVDGEEKTYTIYNSTFGYLIATDGATTITGQTDKPSSSAGYWQFFTQDDMANALDWASATEDAPIDVTFYIDGCNFVRNCDGFKVNEWATLAQTTVGPWTVVATTVGNQKICGPQPEKDTETNQGCEFYGSRFDLWQEINVPNGKYKLALSGFDNGKGAVIYANDKSEKFTQTENKSSVLVTELARVDEYSGNEVTVTVTDKTLKLGVKREGDEGGWTAFDNFRLYYLGEVEDQIVTLTPVDATMEEYAESMPEEYTYTITDANGNDITSKVTLTTKPTIKATYTKAKDGTDYTTEVTKGSAAGEYTLTASGAVAEGYLFNYAEGKLTINAKTYEDTENLKFEDGDPLTENVTSYDYDTALNGTTRYGLQTVQGWTANQKGNSSDGNARAGGMVAYGSNIWFGGTGYAVPEADDTHTGNALAVVAVWGATATYTSTSVSLPAGQVTITIPVYNNGATGTIVNQNKVTLADGTVKSSSTESFTKDTWTNDVISFQLEKATTATITLGYTNGDSSGNNKSGNAGTQHLFYDGVTISSTPIVTVKAKDINVKEYEDFTLSYTATDADGNEVTLKTDPTLTAKASYGSTAIKGSDNGEYTITPSGAEVDGYEIVYKTGTLTITEATHSTDLNLELKGNTIVDGVATYDYDRYKVENNVVTNNYTRSGLQPIDGWTASAYDTDRMAGGLFAIGSKAVLKGNGYTAPESQAEGVEGDNVIGLVGVWGGTDGVEVYYSATTDLEAGTYTVTIPVYNAGGTTELKANYTGITCGDASTTATTTKYTVNSWTTEKLTLNVTEKGTATIKIGGLFDNAGSGAAPHLFFGPITLAKNITLNETADDTETLTANDGETANVTLKRTINKDVYNAICLPFDVDKETIAEVFGENAEVAQYNSDTYNSDTGNMSIDFKKSETIKAGVPYLIYSEKAYTTDEPLTFEGVTISSTLKPITGTNYNFVGNFATGQAVAQYDVIISTKGNLSVRNTAATMKGYRSYFKATSTDAQKARSIGVNIGGETTSISNISGLETENGDIYNLRGQKVNNTQKGVYIQNGKKVVIK